MASIAATPTSSSHQSNSPSNDDTHVGHTCRPYCRRSMAITVLALKYNDDDNDNKLDGGNNSCRDPFRSCEIHLRPHCLRGGGWIKPPKTGNQYAQQISPKNTKYHHLHSTPLRSAFHSLHFPFFSFISGILVTPLESRYWVE